MAGQKIRQPMRAVAWSIVPRVAVLSIPFTLAFSLGRATFNNFTAIESLVLFLSFFVCFFRKVLFLSCFSCIHLIFLLFLRKPLLYGESKKKSFLLVQMAMHNGPNKKLMTLVHFVCLRN